MLQQRIPDSKSLMDRKIVIGKRIFSLGMKYYVGLFVMRTNKWIAKHLKSFERNDAITDAAFLKINNQRQKWTSLCICWNRNGFLSNFRIVLWFTMLQQRKLIVQALQIRKVEGRICKNFGRKKFRKNNSIWKVAKINWNKFHFCRFRWYFRKNMLIKPLLLKILRMNLCVYLESSANFTHFSCRIW